MTRVPPLLAVLLVAWGMLGAGPARAAAPTTTAPPLDAATARQALAVLRDPRERALVEHTLEAIIRAGVAPTPVAAAAPATAPATAPAPAKPAATPKPASPVQLNPNGLGAAVLTGMSHFLDAVVGRLARSLSAVQSLPLLWGWLVVMATNPLARVPLLDAAWRGALILALAFAGDFGLRRVLRRAVGRIDLLPLPAVDPGPADGSDPGNSDFGNSDPGNSDPGNSGAIAPGEPEADGSAVARAEAGDIEPPPRLRARDRFGRALARFLLDLAPVLLFAAIGQLAALTPLGGSAESRLIILAPVTAIAVWQSVQAFARFLVAPAHPVLRLIRMSDATAAWTARWVARLAAVAVFAYAIGQAGLLLGMSREAYDGLQKMAGLLNHLFAATMILQKRRPVRIWLRGPEGASGPLAGLRAAIAPWWHWVVLSLLAGEWLVWAVELRHGYTAMVHAVAVVVLVAAGTRLALVELRGALARAVRPAPAVAERYPGLEARLALYHPVLRAMLRVVVLAAGAVVLLELLGVDAIGWVVGTSLGQRLVGGIGTIGVTIILAFAVWEMGNAAMHRHLARLTREAHAARAARMRTLLPLLRTALLVGVGTVAGLTVLSQIGINIAPLLAGAGIIGVAIGFGSQKLVQDLITGIFLLLENAMQVGDWVTVSGLSGSVENLSVRTIRLRAVDGSVHIIPFSSVTSVTNTNRGLGNAAVSVTLAYSEDTDRAGAELKAIAAAMRKDAAFSGLMLSELQFWGVDKLDGAAATLTGQIPCTDTGRWPVQREFNRRVKLRFQELGIALWNPAQSVLLAAPAAPPPEPQAAPRPKAAE